MKKTTRHFIPDIVNPSPDYFCTWQTQLYATSDGKPQRQRDALCEKALFDKEKPYGWAYFHEKARRDLYFVMDDSWDIPFGVHPERYGSLILDKEKFPSFMRENNEKSLAALNDALKALGWKAVGGWVCAQVCEEVREGPDDEAYYIKRFKEADASGFGYYKVDWGNRAADVSFRRRLSELKRQYAPRLILENAVTREAVGFSDTFRTYDVPAVFSIPMTMAKNAEYLNADAIEGAPALICCEDEVYMAASLGCTFGVMRHPYYGALPDGRADMSFPAVHRDIKRRMNEVARAARFHRIAPAFGVERASLSVSDRILTDDRRFERPEEEIESWWFENDAVGKLPPDGIIRRSAPAAIARRMPLPDVTPDENGEVPFVTASRHPNGTVAVAAHGRTHDRRFMTPLCDISVKADGAENVGVFGAFGTLFLEGVKAKTVYAEDLIGGAAYDITDRVRVTENGILLDGGLLTRVGTEENDPGDISDAGVLLHLE